MQRDRLVDCRASVLVHVWTTSAVNNCAFWHWHLASSACSTSCPWRVFQVKVPRHLAVCTARHTALLPYKTKHDISDACSITAALPCVLHHALLALSAWQLCLLALHCQMGWPASDKTHTYVCKFYLSNRSVCNRFTAAHDNSATPQQLPSFCCQLLLTSGFLNHKSQIIQQQFLICRCAKCLDPSVASYQLSTHAQILSHQKKHRCDALNNFDTNK